eukprot:gene1451-biopygen1311
MITKNEVEWRWGPEQQWAFEDLKAALVEAPVLALPNVKAAGADGSAPFVMQTDASGVALGGVLMQDGGEGLKVIAYESRQFSAAEQTYHTGERELCGLHHCTTVTWRHYLIFTAFKLQGGHRPLEWLIEPGRELSRRHARWYNARYMHDGHGPRGVSGAGYGVPTRGPGELQVDHPGADPLTEVTADAGGVQVKHSGADLPMEVTACAGGVQADSLSRQVRYQAILYEGDVGASGTSGAGTGSSTRDVGRAAEVRDARGTATGGEVLEALRSSDYTRDGPLRALREQVQAAIHHSTKHVPIVGEVLWRVSAGHYQLVLGEDSPLREIVFREAHDSLAAAGHTGRDKTLERVLRRFWWENASDDGVGVDFVTGIPLTEQGDHAFVAFTCKLSKMVHVVPMNFGDSSAATIARTRLLLHGVEATWCAYENRQRPAPPFPGRILGGADATDDGSQGGDDHPVQPPARSDGQAEHTNRVMEDMLHSFVDDNLEDWDLYATNVEFAINDSRSDLWDARGRLELAQQRQRDLFDQRHGRRGYAVGDLVWVSPKHLTEKLVDRPLCRNRSSTSADTDRWRGADAFASRRHPAIPEAVIVDGQREAHVDRILARRARISRGKEIVEWKVRWTGYSKAHDSWRTRDKLERGAPLQQLQDFEFERLDMDGGSSARR